MFCTFTLVFSELFMQCPTWPYFVAPCFSASRYVAKILLLLLLFPSDTPFCGKGSVIWWPHCIISRRNETSALRETAALCVCVCYSCPIISQLAVTSWQNGCEKTKPHCTLTATWYRFCRVDVVSNGVHWLVRPLYPVARWHGAGHHILALTAILCNMYSYWL